MPADWKALVKGEHFTISGYTIKVSLARADVASRRRHSVFVVRHDDGWELSGQAASAAQLKACDTDAAELWSRNRRMRLAHYVVDESGYAWVTAWMPDAGTTPEEFSFAAWHVALEADRLEFLLTGEDEY